MIARIRVSDPTFEGKKTDSDPTSEKKTGFGSGFDHLKKPNPDPDPAYLLLGGF